MAAPVSVSVQAIDESRWRFSVDRVVHQGEPQHFASCEQAAGIPLAEAVLDVPGVAEVDLIEDGVIVIKKATAAWEDIEERVRYAIAFATTDQEPAVPHGTPMDDETVYGIVAEMFSREINPAVAQHGGKVELIDVQDATVIVRMLGGCQGCGMANVTLRQGIEGSLRRVIPGLNGIEDITDHSAGTDPYFSSEKK